MGLQQLNFTLKAENPKDPVKDWFHYGVVGSGDMEVLIERQELGGAANVKIVTPVKGFDKVWSMVLERFVKESRLGNVSIEINDNNATPIVASMRLRQALAESAREVREEA